MRNMNEKCDRIGGEFLLNLKGGIKIGMRVGILFIFLFL